MYSASTNVQRHIPVIRMRPVKPHIKRHFDLGGMHKSLHFREVNIDKSVWEEVIGTQSDMCVLSSDCLAQYLPEQRTVRFLVHLDDDIRQYEFKDI